ncbi:hypothetical protein [Kribbella caucasensis]|uniref:hypothetical protein n=1 Tax=Kribbella caucasensis TaxID=2512215 RepID=UPI00105B249C|nr:hypothetical protein [Kribbella sp. VKM Ac-2527]
MGGRWRGGCTCRWALCGDGAVGGFDAVAEADQSGAALSSGDFRWLRTESGVLAFTRGDGFSCVVNCSSRVVAAPVGGQLLLASHHEAGDKLPEQRRVVPVGVGGRVGR